MIWEVTAEFRELSIAYFMGGEGLVGTIFQQDAVSKIPMCMGAIPLTLLTRIYPLLFLAWYLS